MLEINENTLIDPLYIISAVLIETGNDLDSVMWQFSLTSGVILDSRMFISIKDARAWFKEIFGELND